MTTDPKSTPSNSPNPEVSDPHPGSISDGTRPDADETGDVQREGETEEDRRKREQAGDPALMPIGDPAGMA